EANAYNGSRRLVDSIGRGLWWTFRGAQRRVVSSRHGIPTELPAAVLRPGASPQGRRRGPGRIVTPGPQAQEPPRDRDESGGGAGGGQGARRGDANGRAGGHHG